MSTIINNISQKEKRRNLRKKQTPEESKIWSLLRNSQLGVKFRRQVSIGEYIADFYCREKQLVIEIDGEYHEDTLEYDKKREVYFSSCGIKTVRFKNAEINENIVEVKRSITNLLRSKDYLVDPLKVRYY
jgi:very-short-patch-repair endonuclease